ncbi:hypothetical protein LMG31884_47110 (plasmid) [Xanthomonas hydrangeae]|uniref:hypothetical protein n=1 Tax=Xanthomonas hydrangeae TaxID=2775159 RepID=UPI001965F291|nr:hypothetical protein LMG31884_47110 [Xanthomonas hydrangeae]CAD7740967.1 hypothetical protein LMG31884_47110 [Xanthomonas hydrangeae]CAD7747998.1 hypothetical protein LMG31887_46700 [Xanthomonas hydrangeae]CAD7747999.1 hypothetical protein LMG31887_46700 [Xanthomonas hydrangeae]CAD7748124.1 hypothetical protein LMG31885_44790 [Xanthomonas hydrangeae]
MSIHNRPIADEGLTSYRYRGRYGWVMIGALDDEAALGEAERSIKGPADPALLQRWDGQRYADTQVQA